MALMVA